MFIPSSRTGTRWNRTHEDNHRDQVDGGGRGVDEADKKSSNESNANPD